MGRRTQLSFSGLLGALGLGCSAEAVLFLPYPDTAGYASMVLAMDAPSAQPLVAIDLRFGAFPVRLNESVAEGETWTAHALLFHETLEELRVREGRLTENPTNGPYPIRLDPDAILTRSAATADELAWDAPVSVPSRLTPLLVRNDDPYYFCPPVEQSQVDLLDVRNPIYLAVSLGRDRAFLGTSRSRASDPVPEPQNLFVFEPRGEELQVRRLDAPEGILLTAGFRDELGELWAVQDDHYLVRLRLLDDRVETTTVSALPSFPGPVRWLGISARMALVMGDDGHVVGATRDNDGNFRWQTEPLYQFSPNFGRNASAGAILLRSATEMWLVRASELNVVRIRSSGESLLTLELDRSLKGEAAIGLATLAHAEGLGTLVGMADGEVRLFDEQSQAWRSLGPTRFTQIANALLGAGKGFFMGGGTGLYNFYVHPEGYCPLEAAGYMGLRASATIRYALPMGDGILCAGTNVGVSSQAVTWVRPRW